jgi:hypothetical protein
MKLENSDFEINFVEWECANQMYIVNLIKCELGECVCPINGFSCEINYFPTTDKYMFSVAIEGNSLVEEWIDDPSQELRDKIGAAIKQLESNQTISSCMKRGN